MTPEEKSKYNTEYRKQGYGAAADARYRERHKEKYRERNRLRMLLKRREA